MREGMASGCDRQRSEGRARDSRGGLISLVTPPGPGPVGADRAEGRPGGRAVKGRGTQEEMEGREETKLLKLHEDWDCRRGSRITRRTHASGPETRAAGPAHAAVCGSAPAQPRLRLYARLCPLRLLLNCIFGETECFRLLLVTAAFLGKLQHLCFSNPPPLPGRLSRAAHVEGSAGFPRGCREQEGACPARPLLLPMPKGLAEGPCLTRPDVDLPPASTSSFMGGWERKLPPRHTATLRKPPTPAPGQPPPPRATHGPLPGRRSTTLKVTPENAPQMALRAPSPQHPAPLPLEDPGILVTGSPKGS